MKRKPKKTDLLPPLIEFETKYRVAADAVMRFKHLVSLIPGDRGFKYVEGPDEYWLRGKTFARYRRPDSGTDTRAEVTMKAKPKGAKTNTIRREWNWRVDNTPAATVREGLKDLGFRFGFKIWKSCHIYDFGDANVVFYTVVDVTDAQNPVMPMSFVEIEVNEHDIEKLTEVQAWAVVTKYESKLGAIGVTAKTRLKKSLFDIYGGRR